MITLMRPSPPILAAQRSSVVAPDRAPVVSAGPEIPASIITQELTALAIGLS